MIAFIDLDDFKRINDQYGHEAGDRFLVQVGNRLTHQQTQDEIIGRLGGDEFLVASLSHSNDGDASTEVNAIKTRLNGRIAGEYGLGNVTILYPGASYGVVIVDPHCTDEDSALRTADLAMYQDKKGKNKTGFVALD